jgi:multidrug efflux pump subunit AcrA (membrane-fusion protein)
MSVSKATPTNSPVIPAAAQPGPVAAEQTTTPSRWGLVLSILGVGAAATAGWLSRDSWAPGLATALGVKVAPSDPASTDHAGHGQKPITSHHPADEVQLSPAATLSIGLRTGPVETSTYRRSITVPGKVVERKGRTRTRCVAPFTGVVRQLHVVQGEAIPPRTPLYDIRLMHEDLVTVQVDFLNAIKQLEVIKRDIERLTITREAGALSERAIIEREYQRDLQAVRVQSSREALLLHGLPQEEINAIEKTGSLRSELTVEAPASRSTSANAPEADRPKLLVVEDLAVEVGRMVQSGELILTLSDYSELLIEANPVEQELPQLMKALRSGWPVTAQYETAPGQFVTVTDLTLLYSADAVDPESHTGSVYIRLRNTVVHDAETDGRRYINWRFKPGQRMRVQIPVEEWTDRLVLPSEAVVRDGAEWYVFLASGGHFRRHAVHVLHSDLTHAVVRPDGKIKPGVTVAMNGAQQLNLQLKSQAAGERDHGHDHDH